MKNCARCYSILSGKQEKFCSPRCSKLYLKAQYRNRNTERIKEYNAAYRKRTAEHRREYNQAHRAMAAGGYQLPREARLKLLEMTPRCLRCNADQNLQACHVKPHWAGGTNKLENFFVMCGRCHQAFDKATRNFWLYPATYEHLD